MAKEKKASSSSSGGGYTSFSDMFDGGGPGASGGARGGGYTSFSDMFDGGGPGASGGPFQGGGLLSAFGNAITGNRGMGVGPEAGVGFAGYGYNDAAGNWVPASIDMRNGGGPGRAGPTFQGGGHYSGILNMLGVRPLGYEETMAAGGYGGAATTPTASSMAPTSSPTPRPRAPGASGVPALAPANTAVNDPFIGLSRLFSSRLGSPQLGPTIENLMRSTMTEDQLSSALGPNDLDYSGVLPPPAVPHSYSYARPSYPATSAYRLPSLSLLGSAGYDDMMVAP